MIRGWPIKLYADETHEYFFLVPEDVEIRAGDALVIALPSQQQMLVDPDDMLRFECTLEEAHTHLVNTLEDGFEAMLRGLGDGFQKLVQLANDARDYKSPDGDPQREQELEAAAENIWRGLGKAVDGFFGSILAEIEETTAVSEDDVAAMMLDNDTVVSILRDTMVEHPGQYWVVAAHRSQQIRVFALEDEALLGGSKYTDDVAIRLLGTDVARVHFMIRPDDDGYVLTDNFSASGTFVNGMRLNGGEPYPLQSGDMIRIADHYLRYVVWLD